MARLSGKAQRTYFLLTTFQLSDVIMRFRCHTHNQTCRLRSFYALFIAEVGADWPFLKALQVGDTKCQNCLLPLFLFFPKLKIHLKKAPKKACALFGALFSMLFQALFFFASKSRGPKVGDPSYESSGPKVGDTKKKKRAAGLPTTQADVFSCH